MSNNTLSPKELRALRYIRNQLVHKGVSPSVRDIMAFLDYKSPHSAMLFLDKVKAMRIIVRSKKTGGLELLKDLESEKYHATTIDIPLVGNVPCGRPLLAEENIETHVPVSTRLAKPPYQYFLLRAVGDSMNKKGIEDGNLVLVRQQPNAENGDTVVALIDDEATIKELHKEKDVVILEPKSGNKSHKPIVLDRDFAIQGRIIATVKNL